MDSNFTFAHVDVQEELFPDLIPESSRRKNR